MQDPFAEMTQDDRNRLLDEIVTGLLYYADPNRYFAVGIFRRPKVDEAELGDLRFDYADQCEGAANSIKPGQLARAAAARGEQMLGEEHPMNWDEGEMVDITETFMQQIGIDTDFRYHPPDEDPEPQQTPPAEAEPQRTDCCNLEMDEGLFHVDVQMREIPRADGSVEKVLPIECPNCGAPAQGIEADWGQPHIEHYGCGAWLNGCGHMHYTNGARERLRCEFIAHVRDTQQGVAR